MSIVAKIVVVGFHHKKGCQAEYVFPQHDSEEGKSLLPVQWEQLPALALPDGSHNHDQDVVFFALPSLDSDSKDAMFAISCTRQIATQELLAKEEDVTRSTVQKSVTVVTKVPLYGLLKAKLQLITHAYFNEKDFSKVLFYMNPSEALGDTLVSLLSLFPRSFESLACCLPLNEDHDGQYCEEVKRDSYGFPMQLFSHDRPFIPYATLSCIDFLSSPRLKSFTMGTTNALFATKKNSFDVVITVDEEGQGDIEIFDAELRRQLTLTTPDLRFCDFILKSMEVNRESTPIFEGGDEWIRLQMRTYLLALAASTKSGLQTAISDYSTAFVTEWQKTRNYQEWQTGTYDDITGIPPGHAFSGQVGVHDVILRVENSKHARKAFNAIASTGRNIGEAGERMRNSLSNWFRGPSDGIEAFERQCETSESVAQGASEALEFAPQATPPQYSVHDAYKSLSSWFKAEDRRTKVNGIIVSEADEVHPTDETELRNPAT